MFCLKYLYIIFIYWYCSVVSIICVWVESYVYAYIASSKKVFLQQYYTVSKGRLCSTYLLKFFSRPLEKILLLEKKIITAAAWYEWSNKKHFLKQSDLSVEYREVVVLKKTSLRKGSNFEVWGTKVCHRKSGVSFLQHVCMQFENLTLGKLEVLCWIQICSRGWVDWTRIYFFINSCLCVSEWVW